MFMPGRSAATSFTGWGMVLSAGAAVLVSLAGVSPHAPLIPAPALAGLSVLFAAAWVVASYRAGTRTRDPLSKPYRETRRPNRALRYVLGFGVTVSTAAALLTVFTISGEYGRETERLERAGYDQYRVPVVRLVSRPEFHEGDDDADPYYTTDLVLRIPYETGPREVTVRGMYTRVKPPVAGRTKVSAYFAPRDPEVPVVENGIRDTRWFFLVPFAVWGGPWTLIAGGILSGCMDDSGVHRLRRFEPGLHLPALGILLLGLVLLLPVAAGFEVAGYDRLPALLAVPTPALAFTWLAKRG
ncbi:hypothetical protein [Streptomyces vietnamensis]|uniref:DUF3592 domain-containing protein n=1 Tax=Streptomyces vietnamensis TaxID=362257 RepID=A0A0B5I6A5_9ACTN|nr:hypothetical protein [Streptomyces vietnamensis]AJF65927.1 hypothetical protein SVTN_17545 [Streptomyces vietnamensis]